MKRILRKPSGVATQSRVDHQKRGGLLPSTMLAIAGIVGSVTACVEEDAQDGPAVVEVQRQSLEAQSSVVEGIGATLAESFLRTSDGVELAFLVKDDPEFPGARRGVDAGILEFSIRDEDGNFAPIPVQGLENLQDSFGQKVTAYEGPNGILEIFIENSNHIYRYQGSIVEGTLHIQAHPDGNEILDPDNPENLLGATYSQAVPEGVVVVHARKVYLFSSQSNDPQFLGNLTNDEDDRLTAVGDLPDLSASGYTIFLDGQVNGQTGLREVRVNLSQGTILERLKAGLGSGDVDSEPVRIDGRNEEAIWVQVGYGNEVYIGRSNGNVERLSLELDPIIPPLDAAVPDAAAQDAGVVDAAEQDAATSDAGAADAEVSPADSSRDAEVSQPDAALADMSVSPDDAAPDAAPDGGMVEEDSAIPDQGVDMAADRGVEQPPVCGDSICGIEESVNSCLVDCFKAFRMSEGECSVEVRLVDDVIVEFTGNGEVTDKCIAEIDVPGFADPVRYIVSFDPEGEPQAGRIEFEGVIFLGEDGAPEFGTALGRNVHTVVELEENGQQWRVGNLDGLSLAGVATKIFLVKESETDGRQVWRATNNNTLIEGPVFAFDPKGNVVAVLPPAATIRFSVQDGGETVKIEAIEQGEPEPGIRIIGGSGCADADCDTNPEKGPTTPATPIALVLLALARIPLRRKN